MESFYYQNEEWVNLQETITWIYYCRDNREPPTFENSKAIVEELKEAIESKQIKVIRSDKARTFKMEEWVFFNATDVRDFFKIETYLFYKTAVEHLEHFNQVIHIEAPLPKQSVEEELIIPIRGNKKSMQEWIKHVITVEKGFSLDSLLPAGLQQELINRAIGSYGYKDGTAVKTAWAALGLKSAHKTT